MTKEEFKRKVEVLKDFDFSYGGRHFFINTIKDKNEVITFGEEFTEPKKFESFTHLMAEAHIGTARLEHLLESIN